MPIYPVPLTLLAAASFVPWITLLYVAIAVPALVVAWIFRRVAKHAEEDLKLLYPEQWKLLHPEQPEPEDDGSGKRPGQFGIFDLLVLMTVAAVACAVVRLPIHAVLKMFALVVVWLGFTFWACGRPDARQARSLAFKRRLAVMHAVGSILTFTPYLWLHFVQRPSGSSYVSASLMVLILLGPMRAIWSAASAVRAEFAAGRRKRAVNH